MEVVALIEVLDEPGMCRLPAQQRAGQHARDRVAGREEAGQEAEVPARLAGRDGDHRDVELRPITSAMARIGTPSSATARSRAPACAFSTATRTTCSASR